MAGYESLSLDEQFEAIRANLATSNGLTALGACIFAGGFSLGMEQAGFDVAGHLELPDLALGSTVSMQRWPVAVAPLNSSYSFGSDDHKAAGLTWMSFIDGLVRDGLSPDVFYANPPCVAYAGPGKHDGALDERMCYVRYCAYEAAWRLKPKVWVWELVPGIFGKERNFLDAMAFRAKREGYRCYAFLTSSAIHGGFQDRRRFHFIASRYDIDFEGVYERESADRRGSRSIGEALEIVQNARVKFADRANVEPGLGLLPNDENVYNGAFTSIMPFTPPGSHLRDVPEEIMYEHYRPHGAKWSGRGLPGFSHTRARLDKPSPNILGGHTVIHPIEDRYITPREAATIMGFPIDYVFSDGAKAYQEIGRGLCTHNAAFLGRAIADAIRRNVRTVPTRSNEKGHEMSWMQAIDWRNRGTRLNIKMSPEEKRAWWIRRHGEPVPKGL